MKYVAIALLAFVAVAAASDLMPLRSSGAEKRAPMNACSNNPCGTGETCCAASNGEAGCCPAPNACCCPDQAHCCKSPYQCQCTGTCPGSGCTCTGCTTTGKCESSVF